MTTIFLNAEGICNDIKMKLERKTTFRVCIAIVSFVASLLFYWVSTKAFFSLTTLSPVSSALLCGLSMALGGLLLFYALFLIINSDLALVLAVAITSAAIVGLLVFDAKQEELQDNYPQSIRQYQHSRTIDTKNIHDRDNPSKKNGAE